MLAIETSTLQSVLVLIVSDRTLLEARPDPARRHARELVPAMDRLLRQAGIRPRQLEAIAVGLGPGSFTGLRVGLAAAKTLAYVNQCRLLGIDSLAVIAAAAPPEFREIVVAADAQRGEWFVARFRRDRETDLPRRKSATQIELIARVLASIGPNEVLIGPGLERLKTPSGIPEGVRLADPSAWFPQADALSACALDAWQRGVSDDPWTLEPIYIRRSAAEEKTGAGVPR
jgi:tRNA threonylcarbamoyladenosine biosynthesis protein TsaB